MKKEVVLVVAAHPDDEVLGCGGTIRRLAEEGSEVYIAILGEGITSRYADTDGVKEQIQALKQSSREAAKLLGAKDIFLFDLPDNKFDTVPFIDIVKKVEGLIAQIAPVTVFTHHGSDLNIDHKITHQAVVTATRPVKGMQVKTIYMFEIPSSTEWAFSKGAAIFCPNIFYDITNTIDIKIEALKFYDTEIREFPHPRSPEALTANGRKWGSTAGLNSAEAFEILREIK